MLIVALSGTAFVVVSTTTSFLGSKEFAEEQQSHNAGYATGAADTSSAASLPASRNQAAAIDKNRGANADDAGNRVGEKLRNRVSNALFDKGGLLAASAFFFLALGTALAVSSANRGRQSSRCHLLAQCTAGASGKLKFAVRNLGPTLAFLRGYRVLTVEDGFDPRKFGRCAAVELTALSRTVEVGTEVELEVPSTASSEQKPWLLVEISFEDVFHTSRRSWRLFFKEGASYEEGDDGELPTWWSD